MTQHPGGTQWWLRGRLRPGPVKCADLGTDAIKAGDGVYTYCNGCIEGSDPCECGEEGIETPGAVVGGDSSYAFRVGGRWICGFGSGGNAPCAAIECPPGQAFVAQLDDCTLLCGPILVGMCPEGQVVVGIDPDSGIACGLVVCACGDTSTSSTTTTSTTTTSGTGTTTTTLVLMGEACIGIEDITEGDDQYNFWVAPAASTIQSVACYCTGSCSFPSARPSIQDGSGHAIDLVADLTCETSSADATWVSTVQGDPDRNVSTGEAVQFSIANSGANQPSPASYDHLLLCIQYTR